MNRPYRVPARVHAPYVDSSLLMLALLAPLLLAPWPAAAEPLFGASFLSVRGGYAGTLWVGDINHDGHDDMVMPDWGTQQVAVLLGRGDGTFEDPRVFGNGVSLTVAVGDMNGDGESDIVVQGNSKVSVLFGHGNGTFGPQIDSASPARLAAVFVSPIVLVDLNRDRKLDVVLGAEHSVWVALGAGDGTVGPGSEIPFEFPQTLAAADFNRDGLADLAVLQRESEVYQSPFRLMTMTGRGDGTFNAPVPHGAVPYGASAAELNIADINRDRRADLITSHGYRLGNGDGSFSPEVLAPAGEAWVEAADLDDDGRTDLVAIVDDDYFPWLRIRRGNGDGSFGPGIDTFQGVRVGPGLPGQAPIVAGNFDGVRGRDLAVYAGVIAFRAVTILLNNGDQTFGTRVRDYVAQVPNVPAHLVFGDVNEDGKVDVVRDHWLLLGNGDGTLQEATQLPFGTSPYALRDINHDGHGDLIGGTGVMLGRGDGTFGNLLPTGAATQSQPYQGEALGDLDGDGELDLVVSSDDGYSVMKGKGDGTFAPRADYPSFIVPRGLVDLNGDGKRDLYGGDGLGLSILLGNGDGTFGPLRNYGELSDPTAIAAGDLNGDGKVDFFAIDMFVGISVYLGQGDGAVGPQTFLRREGMSSNSPHSLALADLNGDGRLDAAIVGNRYVVEVLLGNGDGTFANGLAYGSNFHSRSGFSALWQVGLADLDGDRNLDLVAGSPGLIAPMLHVPASLVAFNFQPPVIGTNTSRDRVTGTLKVFAPWGASDIDVASIRLNDVVAARGAAGGGGGRTLSVEFDWNEVRATLAVGEKVPVRVTGVIAGRAFTACDTIRVDARARDPERRSALSVERGPGLALAPQNPSRGHIDLRLSLASAEPASLEVYDVNGRHRASRAVESSAGGWRTMAIGDLPAGVYWVRLEQAGERATSRVLLLR